MAITELQSSLLRSILRSAVLLVTAFGLSLTAEQVAAIQLGTEALLAAAVKWNKRD